jgi:ComF family protein
MFGESVQSLVCSNCRAVKATFDAGHSAYLYADALRELIHLFKYGKRRYLGSFLGGLLADSLRSKAAELSFDAIVPVPLHWWRYCSRGFNQATDLARPLSRQLHVPILKKNLRRIRHTPPQVSLSPKERKSNIRNAFKVSRPAKVRGKRLLLIDDIITTGSTLNECARVLKAAGAAGVTILTLAHPTDLPSRSGQNSRFIA